MTTCIAPLALLGLVGLVLFLSISLHRRKLSAAAAEWGRRPPMSEGAFLKECQVPDEPFATRAALAARAAIASLATVPSDAIYPADTFIELQRLPFWDSLDWLGFVLEVEKQSGAELRVMGGVAGGAVQAAGGFKSLRVEHIIRAVVCAAVPREA